MKTTAHFFSLFLLLCSFSALQAQTTAMDFNTTDCNGNQRHLFAELDSNHVAILEFFMLNCNSCITAGNKIKALKNSLDAQYPGKIHSYSIGYSNSYSCTNIVNWVNNNNFGTVPMDSGATQVAYYGGFGMPTVVVVGGANHDVLFSTVGFSTSDTTAMGTEIRGFFNSLNTSVVNTNAQEGLSVQAFPNPAQAELFVQLNLDKSADVSVQLMNVNGQVVLQSNIEQSPSGSSQQILDVRNLPAGIYLLKTTAKGLINTQKVVLGY